MEKPIKRIAVTGGAGQIAYSVLFRIASGELLGHDQPIALHILEIPDLVPALEGIKMELEDCAFPLLREIRLGSDPYEIFKEIDYALLIGSKPRTPGMERKELLQDNGKIFVEQGQALNEVAQTEVKVFVVGNPCNTNCLIAMSHAPRLSRKNFYAMTRLDQNRAAFQLAYRAKVDITAISHLAIWGNHSTTQVPDFFHARIRQQPALSVIQDLDWLENDFMALVQKRGAVVLQAKGKSSAASAANALIGAVRDMILPTPQGQWFSSGVDSTGNPYNISPHLIFSFPCFSQGEGYYQIVPNLDLNDFLSSKIKLTEQELIEERDLVRHMVHF